MKHFLLATLFALCATHVSAQDVIVKKDGSTILSKVLEVNSEDVKYKKSSNKKGPTYTIKKSEILSINYENGEKDDFSNVAKQNEVQQTGQGLVNKPADANNVEIINRHNVVHPYINGVSPSTKAEKWGVDIKFGIKSSSIMSNEEVEMEFVYKDGDYYINIKNKTDKVLYIDKGNCFKIFNDGYSYCYYDASIQTTVNNGGGSGGSVNMGSIAGAIGVGGILGQIAGGVNVGGGTSSSVSTTYMSQRINAIPPHGSKFLTENIWVGEGKRRRQVEYSESLEILPSERSHDCKSTVDIGLKRGIITKSEMKVFEENDLPWKREYYITYSTDANFSSYSTLHAELYIQEVIGSKYGRKLSKEGKWRLNENMMISFIWGGFDKK